MCFYFHSEVDRRRVAPLFAAELCKAKAQKLCTQGDACNFSHSNVERLYHVEKYKTKFCSSQTDKCPYGQFCSFAHSELDIKTRLIHNYARDQNFYMYYFKTEWCPFQNNQHNKAKCVYAHNWQDFRRKPHFFDYDPRDLC